MKLNILNWLKAIFAISIAVAVAAGCNNDDDDNGELLCDDFSTSSIFISGNITGGDYVAMTNTGSSNWEYVIDRLEGEELSFIIANTNDGANATWGDSPSATGNSDFAGKASRKVSVNGEEVCGDNRSFSIIGTELENQKIAIRIDVATEAYEITVSVSDACEDYDISKMWAYWRVDDADPGSFGFEEMTEIEPGVFEITRLNFQPCCGAWPVKFVNTPDFTQADWGREEGFSPDPNFDPPSRNVGRKVIEPVFENGIKIDEVLVCGANTNIRFPTAGTEGKNIRVIFDANKEEYTWVVEERDPCEDVNKNRMWVYWRVDDADPGSFGFQEMTEFQPGVFEIFRENFQPCCGAWPVKFVNTPDFTEADWGREEGFSPDPNFDPLSRNTGRKVIEPIFENGIKVDEVLICGANSNIRFPTADTEGKTIRLIFDSNTEEYTWITQ